MFAALALIMSYVEQFIPVPVPVPGVKPGLANIVVLLALYAMDEKSALAVSLVRVIIASLLFSGMAGFVYSLAGAILSLMVMIILKIINYPNLHMRKLWQWYILMKMLHTITIKEKWI